MSLPDFESFSIIVALAIFLAAGVLVWVAGSRLSALADRMAGKTGLGRAFVGVLLLGGITSLPEVATTLTASMEGNAGMAASNILGSISMQIMILALVDFWQRKHPQASSPTNVVIIIQSALLILMLAFCGSFVLMPSVTIYHVGLNSVLIFLIFLGSLYLVHRYNAHFWQSYQTGNTDNLKENISLLKNELRETQKDNEESPGSGAVSMATFLKAEGWKLFLLSLTILVCGFFVVQTSEAIAAQTGISTNFAGLVLVAITTSLPELSTILASIRMGKYDMAISNIFGTNLFNLALLFLADLFFMEGAVFDALDDFTLFATFHGILLTVTFLIGLVTQSKRQVMGIGFHSAAMIAIYLLGVIVLFHM